MKKAAVPSILVAVVLLALGVTAEAQQPAKIPRIGFQFYSPFSALAARVEGFRQGLRELGYVEGKNIIIEWRSAEGKPAAMRSPPIGRVARLTSSSRAVRRRRARLRKSLRGFPLSWRWITTRLETGLSPA